MANPNSYATPYLDPEVIATMEAMEQLAVAMVCAEDPAKQAYWERSFNSWLSEPGVSPHLAEIGANVATLNAAARYLDYEAIAEDGRSQN